MPLAYSGQIFEVRKIVRNYLEVYSSRPFSTLTVSPVSRNLLVSNSSVVTFYCHRQKEKIRRQVESLKFLQ